MLQLGLLLSRLSILSVFQILLRAELAASAHHKQRCNVATDLTGPWDAPNPHRPSASEAVQRVGVCKVLIAGILDFPHPCGHGMTAEMGKGCEMREGKR